MKKDNKMFVTVICVLLALYIISVTYYISDLYNRVSTLEHSMFHLLKGTTCAKK
ncbi:MAG: hypothetical protein WC486_04770 [Candidatus Omnitrophota bacterium]